MEDLRSSRACCGLVPTAPTEDALRTIFVLSGRGDEVSTSALARHLGVAPPTVSVMLKRLAEHGLVERAADHRASLTPHGAGHARHVVGDGHGLAAPVGQVEGEHPHEVHPPDAGPEGHGAGREPERAGVTAGAGHAAAQVERGVGGERGNDERGGDEGRVVGAEHAEETRAARRALGPRGRAIRAGHAHGAGHVSLTSLHMPDPIAAAPPAVT